jgi:16S rRNA (adenine1518-N6/adenine1519-N6)-dimethyltransferase
VLERIVAEVAPAPDDTIVEIGAGLGDLTEILAEKARLLVALELDQALVSRLTERFRSWDRVRIVHEDALSWPLPQGLVQYPRPRKIVGNLPYNVATRILMRFSSFPQDIDLMVFMFQMEVAKRLCADPGSHAFGGLSVLVQLHWDVSLAFRVQPSAFHPAPKVESALVTFRPLPGPRVEVGEWRSFQALVKASFGQRRKTLGNALKTLGQGDRLRVAHALERAGIDGRRRAETLSLEDFARLSRAFQETGA